MSGKYWKILWKSCQQNTSFSSEKGRVRKINRTEDKREKKEKKRCTQRATWSSSSCLQEPRPTGRRRDAGVGEMREGGGVKKFACLTSSASRRRSGGARFAFIDRSWLLLLLEKFGLPSFFFVYRVFGFVPSLDGFLLGLLGFTEVYWVILWVYCFLTEFYWVLTGFTGFYRVWLGLTGFLPSLTGFLLALLGSYRAFLGFTGFTGFYQVFPGFLLGLRGFTEFYWVSMSMNGSPLGFAGFYWITVFCTGFFQLR